MDIRQTRILHRRYNREDWQKKKIKQGEIGLLLSDDKSTVLEVRVGTTNGIDGEGGDFFSTGMLVNSVVQDVSGVRQFANRGAFPSMGVETVCYMAQDTNSIWRWDSKSLDYIMCSSKVLPGQGSGWWQEINGGNANLYDDNGFLTLGTSTTRNWQLPEQINK